jgi:predicted  nucleic acid-binding Zn-ribbon protein
VDKRIRKVEQDISRVEAEIGKIEAQIDDANVKMAEPSGDLGDAFFKEYNELKEKLQSCFDEWELLGLNLEELQTEREGYF